MKLIKYLFWVLILLGSLVFLVQLNELNQFDGIVMTIKIPYLLLVIKAEHVGLR